MSQYQEEEYSSNLDLKVWRSLLKFTKNCKKQAILLAIVNILYSFIATFLPMMIKYAIDVFVGQRNLATVIPFIIIYIILIILANILTYLTIDYSAHVEVNMVHDIREEGFKNLQNLSFSYFDTTPVGWILARMTNDAQRIGDCIAWGCLDLVWAFATLVFIIINMFILDVKTALFCLSVMPFMLIVSIFFQKRILNNQRIARKFNSKITGAFNEGITGARTTKTLVREDENFVEFKDLSSQMKKASVKTSFLSSVYLPCIMLLGSLTTALMIFSGGGSLMKGTMVIGTLAAFINLTLQMFEPIQQTARVFAEMQSAQASAERTISLVKTKPEILDKPEVIEKYGDSLNPKEANWEGLNGEIEFKDVSFSYKTGEQVLDSFNLKIEKGEKIALVGETGSGKSTIVNLICRFYEPVSGQILIDGVDYKERSQLWLHSNLGYVLQTPHLFSGTIMENIRYGNLNATDEEIINATKTVNAHEFIMNLNKGFDTDVGEGGSRLSSGEKQLISFARAILKKPAIFVLDEATSSIDTETERLIQEAIMTVLKGRTSFIIAHRLSTIKSCDRILVIEKGKVIESGSHKELLRLKGKYYNLYTNQFIEEQEKLILG